MRKTVLRFFTIADFEEEETWLRKANPARLPRSIL